MLVLSRKQGEPVRIGKDIAITLLDLDGNRVRLGNDAPREPTVIRVELCGRWEQTEPPGAARQE